MPLAGKRTASSSLRPVTQLAMLAMLMAMLNLKLMLMLIRLVKSHPSLH